jgi:hypothetical protein
VRWFCESGDLVLVLGPNHELVALLDPAKKNGNGGDHPGGL